MPDGQGDAPEAIGRLVLNTSGKRLLEVLQSLGQKPSGRFVGPLILTFTCTPVFNPGTDRGRLRQGVEIEVVIPVRSEIRYAPSSRASTWSVYRITCARVDGKILTHTVCLDGGEVSLLA